MLKPVVDSLEDVSEDLRAHYVQADGKFRLDVEGGFKTVEETAGALSALEKERDARKTLEKRLKPLSGIEDIEAFLREAQENKKFRQDYSEQDKEKGKEIQRDAQLEAAKQENAAKAKAIAELEAKYGALQKDHEAMVIRSQIQNCETIRRRIPETQREAVAEILGFRATMEDGKVVFRGRDGKTLYDESKLNGELADVDTAALMIYKEFCGDPTLSNLYDLNPTPTGGNATPSTGYAPQQRTRKSLAECKTTEEKLVYLADERNLKRR